MSSFEIPLPEIAEENFTRAWTRFELVSAAKEWQADKQAAILPTLLRGKLVDLYVDFDDDTKKDLKKLKKTLMEKAGLAQDPLTAGKLFMTRSQRQAEKVTDFVSDLKKLFKRAFPDDDLTSCVLLQRFMTGLAPRISQQVLLQGKPTSLEKAIESAEAIEYAFNFEQKSIEPAAQTDKINTVGKQEDPKLVAQLQQTLEQMTKRLESLETKLQSNRDSNSPRNFRRRGPSDRSQGRSQDRRRISCWSCGELGHLQRDCPLNYYGPAQPVMGWPRK